MKHLIVIFHFMCFAAGTGCVTYVFTLFRKRKIYRNLAISEGIFSLWFLIDCIRSYIRNLVPISISSEFFNIASIALSVTGALFFIIAIINVRKAKLQYRITNLCKVFILVTVLFLAGWIASIIIEWLINIPSLCLAFISQCICVYLITSNEVITSKDWEDSSDLTERETEIVEYLVCGNSYKEIGEALFISPNTVRNHTANIYKKLNVKNKIELINKLKTIK